MELEAHQQLKEVETVEGCRTHKWGLQETLLDDWMRAELVQERQGSQGHAHEGTACTALPLIEGFLVCTFPAQTQDIRLHGKQGRRCIALLGPIG